MTARRPSAHALRSACAGAACTLVAVLGFGASAQAATVSLTAQDVSTGRDSMVLATIRVRDDAGRDDDLRVTVSSLPSAPNRVTVTDRAGLVAAEGCASIDAITVGCTVILGYDGEVLVDARLGAGDDRYEADVSVGSSFAEGGAGDDELLGPVTAGSTGVSFDGGPGRDVLRARAAFSALFDSSPGADLLDAGSGGADLIYGGSPRGVRVDFRTGRGHGGDAEGDRILGPIGEVQGSEHDDRFLAPRRGINIYGGGGDDVLLGGPGDDVLDGGDGDNLVAGGPGDDTLSAGDGGGTARARNRLRGQRGDDELDGSPGRDLLDGGPGRDSFYEVSRGDLVAARDGSRDTVSCRSAAGRVRPRALWLDQIDRVDRFCDRSSIRRRAR